MESPDYELDIEEVDLEEEEEEGGGVVDRGLGLAIVNMHSKSATDEYVDVCDSEEEEEEAGNPPQPAPALNRLRSAREQERRKALSKSYQALRKMVPKEMHGSSRSKAQTLTDARNFITTLKKEERFQALTVEKLLQRNYWLKHKLAKLKRAEPPSGEKKS